ncbi:cardiolipin synthase [bacterium]|nr:cardiolipin synthase [bacterium]
MWFLNEMTAAASTIHLVMAALTIPRILKIKRNSTSAIAWMFGVAFLPFLGVILFWTIGDPEVRKPLRQLGRGPIHKSDSPVAQTTLARAGVERLQRMLARLGETPSTVGNDVRFFTDAHVFYDHLEEAIEDARHEICFQFYTLRPDECGERFARLLLRKAREGVNVYLLFDAIGSVSLHRRFVHRLREGGVFCHPFLPLNLLRRRIQINFRNHRKLVIIDRRVAFTGGMNVGREYLGRDRALGPWYDCHLRIEGPAARPLVEEFRADWEFTATQRKERLPDRTDWEPTYDSSHETDAEARRRGWVQLVSSGPDQIVNRTRSVLFLAGTRTRQRLWLATPYFVPDDSLMQVLMTAALVGVDVRLLTQNNRPDRWVPYFAMRYYWEPLLKAGVKIYQYQGSMMHAKMFVSDDRLAGVGSANLDVRSLALNFELGMLFYSKQEIQMVERLFEKAFGRSIEVGDPFLDRWAGVRLVENFCRLFQPVL